MKIRFAAIAVLGVALTFTTAPWASATPLFPQTNFSGGNYAFNQPIDVTSDGTHLWVANIGGNSVTELNVSDGSWVQTLSGGSYNFAGPATIYSDGTYVWVANVNNNSVTQIDASTGNLVRSMSGGSYGFSYPLGMYSDGTHLWVANNTGASVSEIDVATGAAVQTLAGGGYNFGGSVTIIGSGTTIYVANAWTNSITEMSTSGTLVRVYQGAGYNFQSPQGLALLNGELWVANFQNSSVTHFVPGASPTPVNISDASLKLNGSIRLASDGTNIWVTNQNNATVSVINPTDDSLLTYFDGSSGISTPIGIGVFANAVWVANLGNNSVSKFDLPAPPTTTVPTTLPHTGANATPYGVWSFSLFAVGLVFVLLSRSRDDRRV